MPCAYPFFLHPSGFVTSEMAFESLVFMSLLAFAISCNAATTASPSAIASSYSLTTSTSLPFPTATLSSSSAESYMKSSWPLNDDKIDFGADDLSFVSDPFPDSSSDSNSPVLQVTYPAGSYSHGTGGAQFTALWNPSSGDKVSCHSLVETVGGILKILCSSNRCS